MEQKDFNKFAEKLSYKLEDGRGATSHKVINIKYTSLESYLLYTSRPFDVRIIENLREYEIYTDSKEHLETLQRGFEYVHSARTGVKRLSLLKAYLIGLNERGINVGLMTSNIMFFAGEPKELDVLVFSSNTSVNATTEDYRYRSMNSYVYEVLADNADSLTELRIGDFGATYCARKFYKKYFPERVSEMYVAGRTVEIYDIHDWKLPKVSTYTHHRRPRVSSAFRELLDDSFDYDFLDAMEQSAKNFDLHGTQLDGHFFYDYRGRMYWSGNVNPQGTQENRELTLNGKDIIEYDATCSGIQLGSLLSNNVDMMKKCNVISTGTKEKQDAYQYIADMACKDMGIPVGSIPRSVAKKPVMLLPYGAAARTLLTHAYDASYEEYTKSVEQGNENEYLRDHKAIGKGVFDAVEHYIDRVATYNKILGLVDVKIFSKNGKDYGQYCSWTTPDGLNVNSYSKLPADKINSMLDDGADLLHTYKHIVLNLELGSEEYKCDVMYVEGCNIKFFKNNTPNIGQLVPNFIHSLDATALRFVCKRLLAEGNDVFPIHDCVIVNEEVDQDHISDLFRQAYQYIADYYGVDVNVDGMIVFPE